MGDIHVSPERDSVCVIRLCGRVEAGSSASLRQALVDAMLHAQPTAVLVDVRAVTEIDPLAIGTLRAAHDIAHDMHLDFAVEAAQSPVADMLASADLPLTL